MPKIFGILFPKIFWQSFSWQSFSRISNFFVFSVQEKSAFGKSHSCLDLRRRLSSYDGKDDPRIQYLRVAEQSTSVFSDKSCHLVNSLKSRINLATVSSSPRRHNIEYISGSLGRKPRVPPKPCPSQIALVEAIKTLNVLAESLHKETKVFCPALMESTQIFISVCAEKYANSMTNSKRTTRLRRVKTNNSNTSCQTCRDTSKYWNIGN